jgi:hypothetical protein
VFWGRRAADLPQKQASSTSNSPTVSVPPSLRGRYNNEDYDPIFRLQLLAQFRRASGGEVFATFQMRSAFALLSLRLVLVLILTLLSTSMAYRGKRTDHISSSFIKRPSSIQLPRTASPPLSSSPSPSRDGVVAGVGDEGCRLPSVSKINTLPIYQQALVFFGVAVSLYAGTLALLFPLHWLESWGGQGVADWESRWVPLSLGPIYILAGAAHLLGSVKPSFVNIMPAKGSWVSDW